MSFPCANAEQGCTGRTCKPCILCRRCQPHWGAPDPAPRNMQVEAICPNSKLHEPSWIECEEAKVAAFTTMYEVKHLIMRWSALRALVGNRIAYLDRAALDWPDFPAPNPRAQAICRGCFSDLPAILLTPRQGAQRHGEIEVIVLARDDETAEYLAKEIEAALLTGLLTGLPQSARTLCLRPHASTPLGPPPNPAGREEASQAPESKPQPCPPRQSRP